MFTTTFRIATLTLTLPLALTVALLVPNWARAASIGDKDLPLLNGTEKAKLLYSVTGVTDSVAFDLATLFLCTSTEPTGGNTLTLGVEVFNSGGGLENFVILGVGVVTIPPGQTRTIGTRPTASFILAEDLGGPVVGQGSARILATSKRVLCTAMVVDIANSPPTSMLPLPVFKKTKQKF